MSPRDQDYPWVFRRDEIDILEDELEDLFEAFHRRGRSPSFESAILAEQLDTEERSDRELSSRLGFDVLEPPPTVLSAREPDEPPDDSFEAWQQELGYVRAHPLYQKAIRWTMFVKPAAKGGYEQGGMYAGELFRVYANVNLVPLKIFTALCEGMHEDDIGWNIAEEEYRLALTYLDRILESVALLSFSPDLGDWVSALRTGAKELREDLTAVIARLSQRKKGSV
ncbi:hypothetical protein HY630_01710 [Candidatus Uhrbacteria bacterium]|nr:hypothetical protein [Candidatus Uhrbacteria bacterium]